MSALLPQRKRDFLPPPLVDPTELAEQICTVCEVDEATPELAAGTPVTSTEEMTGIQAFERLHSSLSDPSHRMCFVSTPPHHSWLNHSELWFSMLVRCLLSRRSGASVQE